MNIKELDIKELELSPRKFLFKEGIQNFADLNPMVILYHLIRLRFSSMELMESSLPSNLKFVAQP